MFTKSDDHYAAVAQYDGNKESVLILTADNTQDLEFFYPYYRFIEEGYRVDVATPQGGEFKCEHGMGLKNTLPIGDIKPSQYQLLYIPGGKAPAALKKNKEALELVQRFARSGNPIAAICHGPQVLASADLINDRRIAAWPEVADEIRDAGGSYIDEPTVVDGQFITARWPGDLPSHLACTLQILHDSRPRRKSAAALLVSAEN